jgi:hypothetical protein
MIRPRGEYVQENPWGVCEGMSQSEVNQILVKNGFQGSMCNFPANSGLTHQDTNTPVG